MIAVFALVAIVSCHLQVHSPSNLIKRFNDKNLDSHKIQASIANFGVIPYGKMLSGVLKVANPMTNCQVEDDIADDNQFSVEPQFLLILRGDCPFVTKVRNAQAEYAKLAIIMDNQSSWKGQTIMVNDGFSKDIEIPSVFISEEAGSIMIEFAQSYPSEPIHLSITFPTNITAQVSMILFLDANNRASYIFARGLFDYIAPISQKVKLQVYHNFYTCRGKTCNPEDCFPNTSVCALPPLGDKVGRGQDVINQSLREHFACKDNLKGLHYLSLVDQHCIDYAYMKECSDKQLTKAGLNKDSINSQVDREYAITPADSVVQKTMKMKLSHHVAFYPDVLINNVTYYGEIDALDVFEMICNSLESPPSQCQSFVDNWQPRQSESSLSGWAIMGIVVGSLLVFFLVMICVCRRILRRRVSRQVNDEINQLVSHYITSYETKRIQTFNQSLSETGPSK